MFIYASSIFLTSTAFVSTKAKYGIPLSRYTVFLKTVLQSIAVFGSTFFLKLSFYIKPVFAAGTYHGMLALCLWQTQNRLAARAFAIYVGLSVAEFVSLELEKSAEFLVFATSFIDIS